MAKFTAERRAIRLAARLLDEEWDDLQARVVEHHLKRDALEASCEHPAMEHGVIAGMGWIHCPDCGHSN